MLEQAGITILAKAVDLLFDEGRRVLRERRTRRREGHEGNLSRRKVPVEMQSSANALQSREDILCAPVRRAIWRSREVEIQHLLSLLETYLRNYRLAKEQYAKWGSALVPPIVVSNLEEAEDNVIENLVKLQAALSAVYGRQVSILELERGEQTIESP